MLHKIIRLKSFGIFISGTVALVHSNKKSKNLFIKYSLVINAIERSYNRNTVW